MAKNVEILCKNLFNNQRKKFVKLCEQLFIKIFTCKTIVSPQAFSIIHTALFTTINSLFTPNLFHFSTKPITIPINNLLERI